MFHTYIYMILDASTATQTTSVVGSCSISEVNVELIRCTTPDDGIK